MNKIAITTTFPNWLDYPKQSIPTWLKHLPDEISLMIALDPCKRMPDTENWLFPLLKPKMDKQLCYVSRQFSPEHLAFLERNKETKEAKDYRLDYRRFSFKVFALYEAMLFCVEQKYDYLIWADADIFFKKKMTIHDFNQFLPKNEVASYLGRKDWDHSECGFMIFNLNKGGKEFIDRMHQMYVTDEVLQLKQWHDSFVFDVIKEEFNKINKKDVFLNISKDISGRDVFDSCALSQFMEHKKGQRKHNNVIDLKEMRVKTQNCVDHEIIRSNISENLKLINNWLDYVQPHNEEIVIANAGPSLDPEKIRPFYNRGVKIVAVKHALNKLLDAGIIPWACILLDPREHVKNFITHPKSKDVKWFVASMVSPEVTKALIEQGCEVWGYNAYVGAEEEKLLIGHILITGGSATCTRSIGLLEGLLGFKKMHMFGYDLCSFKRPNMKEKKGDRPVWMRVELVAESAGKEVKRKFYTKGEFLAQVQELKAIFENPSLKLKIYGNSSKGGIIPWIYFHYRKKQKSLILKKKNLLASKMTLNNFFSKNASK